MVYTVNHHRWSRREMFVPLIAAGKKEAILFGTIDSTLALFFAFFINAAILIVAAATFYRGGYHDVAEIEDAYKLLNPLLGVGGNLSARYSDPGR
jgi:Mn2+/Fe2+ NRAMP family transporter